MKVTPLVLLLAAAGSAGAHGFDKPGPKLDDLLDESRKAGKPLLLDFAAVWCQPCKLLDKELEKPENQKLLQGFIFQTYDGERGEGAAAAVKYEVTGYPTLVIVDGKGAVLGRQVGFGNDNLTGWLQTQTEALRADAELEARVRAKPDDLEAMWLLARRAFARDDGTTARAWLTRIEAADKSEDRAQAAEAGWMRVDSELTEKVRREALAAAREHLKKYPTDSERALRTLYAAGADKKTLEEAFAPAVDASKDAGELNSLVYLGLAVGAHDGALRAAEKMMSLGPTDPNAYDTLAEVHNYRGDRARAVETQEKGLALPGATGGIGAAMRANLKRFQTGEPSPDVRAGGKLASALTPGKPRDLITPEAAARQLYTKSAGQLVKACAAKRGKLDEVYLHVQVGADSVKKVDVLDAGASPGLRRCLDQAIRAIKLPPDTKPTRVTFPLSLG